MKWLRTPKSPLKAIVALVVGLEILVVAYAVLESLDYQKSATHLEQVQIEFGGLGGHRFVDPQAGVVCYVFRFDLSCLPLSATTLPPSSAHPRGNS